MSGKTIKKGYKSEIDSFFHDFDKKRPQTPIAKQAEIDKHKPLFDKRDKPIEEEKSEIWEGF